MPLPMVHLAVAVKMAGDLTRPWVPEFLLGSLAPDAIHMRHGCSPEDKRRIHLYQSSAPLGGDACEAVAGLLSVWCPNGSPLDPLQAGYVAHLLTDGLWRQGIYASFLRQAPSGLTPEQTAHTYYRETDEIDRLIFESASWRPEVWRLLARASSTDIPAMVHKDEIDRWRERTLHWFETLAPSTEPLQYLSLAQVQSFAEETGIRIGGWLGERGLWPITDGAEENTP